MIEPDHKDWTWVLDRRCPDCGFDASTCAAADVPALTRQNASSWERLLADGVIQPGRPDPSSWSPLEYACHVRDVFLRYDQRIALMQADDDLHFPNWDQDASAIDDGYEAQDPTQVIGELRAAAELVSTRLDAISGDEWNRPGRRGDGASFTIGTIARYMIHDPIHHVWDVTRRLEH